MARRALETGRQAKEEIMYKIDLIDQYGTHFASFDMFELPREGETIELGFPNKQTAKIFHVEEVVHRMISLPPYETKYVEGVAVPCRNDPPWRWEFKLKGTLIEPEKERVCTCWNTPGETKCEKHGHQSGGREKCPQCGKAYLGYCAEGEYCTLEQCSYVA
jgi:hypothetical protein